MMMMMIQFSSDLLFCVSHIRCALVIYDYVFWCCDGNVKILVRSFYFCINEIMTEDYEK